MPTPVVRVQEKGQVTIPVEIRQKLNLKKGDLVTFVETEDGVMGTPHLFRNHLARSLILCDIPIFSDKNNWKFGLLNCLM